MHDRGGRVAGGHRSGFGAARRRWPRWPPTRRWISIGSLSKLCWGGLRVAGSARPEPVLMRLASLKVAADLGSVDAQPGRRRTPARARGRGAAIAPRADRWSARRAGGPALHEHLPELDPDAAGGRPLDVGAHSPRRRVRVRAMVALRHGVSLLPGLDARRRTAGTRGTCAWCSCTSAGVIAEAVVAAGAGRGRPTRPWRSRRAARWA